MQGAIGLKGRFFFLCVLMHVSSSSGGGRKSLGTVPFGGEALVLCMQAVFFFFLHYKSTPVITISSPPSYEDVIAI